MDNSNHAPAPASHSAANMDIRLPLRKVRCMKCVGKIKQALSKLDGIESLDIDTQQAHITGHIDLNEVINTIENLGYQAGYQHDLPLSGLSCGKCVSKLEAVFTTEPEITQFEVSKTRAKVTGSLTE
ncbi:MAG: cation transporter, partial [Photobacterium halotolerans]